MILLRNADEKSGPLPLMPSVASRNLRCPHCGPRSIGTQRWARLSRELILQHVAEHGAVCRGLTWSEDPHGSYRGHGSHASSDLVTHHLNHDQGDWRPENLTVVCRALNSALD